jgi:hypothetical protein
MMEMHTNTGCLLTVSSATPNGLLQFISPVARVELGKAGKYGVRDNQFFPLHVDLSLFVTILIGGRSMKFGLRLNVVFYLIVVGGEIVRFGIKVSCFPAWRYPKCWQDTLLSVH